MIHPTAIVHPRTELDADVEVGAYAIIGEDVRIGRGTRVGDHARIEGKTSLGEDNRIHPFAVLGTAPQDLKYKGEPTELIAGDRNVFREFVTVHRGTIPGGGRTLIGSDSYLMHYCHVAHDCIIGNHVIMANGATLAGHIEIQDHAIIGGLSAIHQFARVGAYAMVGGMTGISQDILPYTLASGARARLYGVNVVGLRRHGFPPESIQALKNAYRILFRSRMNLQTAMEQVRQEISACAEVENLLRFIRESKRGVCR